MLMNYIRITLRTLNRQKVNSFINIAGLTLGLACFILISLWARHEMSYDRFHVKKDRLFRILNAIDNRNIGASVSYALGPELKRKYPEIEDHCRVWPWQRSLVKYKDKKFDEQNIYLVDPSFFTMFTFPFVKGNAKTALSDLNSLVITEDTAHRYFKEEDPIGKILHMAQFNIDFTVTGVVQDIPSNSHLQFDLAARVEYLGEDRIRRWREWVAPAYVLLHPEAEEKDVEKKIAGIYEEHLDSQPNYKPVLQPVTKVHLYADGQPGLIVQVSIFLIIAVFILVMACINFMNLSTARSARRAREVGIRKVIGGQRTQIIKQFLGESLLLSYLALGLALILVQSVLPVFNTFSGKELSLTSGALDYLTLLVLIVTPVTGILAGSYPAFHLSAFRPADVLKSGSGRFKGRSPFRKILVVFQFSISIGLIAATLTVSKQLQFIRDKDLGLDRQDVVLFMNNPDLNSRFTAFKNALEAESGIIHVTAAAQRPMAVGQSVTIGWDGREDDQNFVVRYTMADYDFFETFNMEIVEGRSFSGIITSDAKEACVINEALKEIIGEESVLGKQIYFNHPEFSEPDRYVSVIGVVKDFHSESLYNNIRPFIFRMYRPFNQYVFIKIDPMNTQDTLKRIESTFNRFTPEYPFAYEFLDQSYESLYQTEKQLGQLFKVFGAFAVFISCLGLFGLASHTAEQRTKEIGIRKVFGANISSIILLLSKQFTKWVLLANVFALPVAFIMMNRWLGKFAYRVHLGWSIFLLAGFTALFVALATIGYQAVRSAMANPVDSLRFE